MLLGLLCSHRFYFNSIKVRLEQTQVLNMPSSASFQFHKGAIRTSCFLSSAKRLSHFNSIKVRLEQRYLNSLILFTGFQFHKGAIRTNNGTFTINNLGDFNSIKVRLEHAYLQECNRWYLYFNSIKVRLEPDIVP